MTTVLVVSGESLRKNPDRAKTMVAEVQKPFIMTDILGTLSRERSETLIGQFKDLGDISQTIPAEECFRVE